MNTKTIPTILTPAQYNESFIAINPLTGDQYLYNENIGLSLWVGRYPFDEDVSQLVNITTTDEHGNRIDIDCVMIKTGSETHYDLNLEQLAEGVIDWE